MPLIVVKYMLKKKLGVEAIEEKDWSVEYMSNYYKIPSTLIIPDGCKKIEDYAFCDCWWLKKVKIPESVEIIGYAAFYNCRNATIILKKPRSFKVIAQTAFLRCKDVKGEMRN